MKYKLQKFKWKPDGWSRCAAIRIATFFGGVVVSSAVTYRYADKKFRDQYQIQLNQVKDFYKSRSEDKDLKEKIVQKYSDYEPEEEERPVGTMSPASEAAAIAKDNVLERLPDEQIENLNRYGYHQVNDIGGKGVRDVDERPPHPKTLPKIRLISRDEYHMEDEDDDGPIEKTSILFYEEDEVAVDPMDEVLDDYPGVLGTDFMSEFTKHKGAEYAYVRNTVIRTDFEIELVRGSYHRDALGFDEDMKRTPRKFRADD